MSDGTPKHQVVIVGGGFGGLLAARGLNRKPVEVTVIDRRNFHLFQPLLYQVATGALFSREYRRATAGGASSSAQYPRSAWRSDGF